MSNLAMHSLPETDSRIRPDQADISTDQRKSTELLFALLFTGLLVWLGSYLVDPGTLPIRQVRIEGEFRNLSTNTLQELVRDKVKGGFFNINVSTVRDTLLTDPWVKNVSVHRVWPDSLRVYVTEQDAIALWKDSGLLNKSGVLFTPDKKTFPENLPTLDGPDGTQSLVMDKYLYLKSKMDPIALKISVLKLNERRAWMFETDNNMKVILGRKDFEERVTRFVELVSINLSDEIQAAESIDMRYPNGFAVRWKQNVNDLQMETGTL
jgi:cell division protein FtsQ